MERPIPKIREKRIKSNRIAHGIAAIMYMSSLLTACSVSEKKTNITVTIDPKFCTPYAQDILQSMFSVITGLPVQDLEEGFGLNTPAILQLGASFTPSESGANVNFVDLQKTTPLRMRDRLEIVGVSVPRSGNPRIYRTSVENDSEGKPFQGNDVDMDYNQTCFEGIVVERGKIKMEPVARTTLLGIKIEEGVK